MPGQFADWAAGLDYAVRQGWLEKSDGDQYRLTERGFARMSADSDLYAPVNRHGTREQQEDMHYAIETSGGDKRRAIDEFCEEQQRNKRPIPDPDTIDSIYDWCKAHPLP